MSHYTTHIERHVFPDETVRWEAWHPALPGCRGQGETPMAAQEALDEARRDYLQALRDCGQPVPEGDTEIKGPVLVFVH